MESFDRISPCLTQLCKNLNCFYFIVNFEVRGFDWLTFALTCSHFLYNGPLALDSMDLETVYFCKKIPKMFGLFSIINILPHVYLIELTIKQYQY
jgi:hypothetical protein